MKTLVVRLSSTRTYDHHTGTEWWWVVVIEELFELLTREMLQILSDLLSKTTKLCSSSSTLSDNTDRDQCP